MEEAKDSGKAIRSTKNKAATQTSSLPPPSTSGGTEEQEDESSAAFNIDSMTDDKDTDYTDSGKSSPSEEEDEEDYVDEDVPTSKTRKRKPAQKRDTQQSAKKRTFEDTNKEKQSKETDEPEPKKRKATVQVANTDIYSHSGVRLNTLKDAAQESFSTSRSQPLNTQCQQPEMMNYQSFDRPQRPPRPLPPILLEAADPNKLPPSLRRLNPDMRIDIFNRKTGKIMTGREAVPIRYLPQALLMHAEYEPIVPPLADPPMSSPGKTVIREGRSAPNVRVSNSITPQSRQGISSHKGEKVTITKGPYRGYVGESCPCS